MQINESIIEEIKEDIGPLRYDKAKRYVSQGRVSITKVNYDDKNNFDIEADIDGNYDDYTTKVSVKNGEITRVQCECLDYYNRYGACKHVAATLLKFGQTKYWDKNYNEKDSKNRDTKKFSVFRKIVTNIYNEQMNTDIDDNQEFQGNIKIEPKIMYDKFESKLRLEFKIGNRRMYKIKDLSEFYTRMEKHEYYKYGDKLEFLHTRQMFAEESKQLLDFILKYAEMLKYAENDRYTYYGNALNQTSITLGESSIDEVFELLQSTKTILDNDRVTSILEFVDGNPNIKFELERDGEESYKIIPNINPFSVQIFNGKKYTYILEKSALYRCSQEFENTTLKLLNIFKESFVQELDLETEDLKDFYGIIMPKVGNCVELKNITEEEMEEYKPKKLGVKVYLDYDEYDYIVADVKFCYGEEEFNPLDEKAEIKYPRNKIDENSSLNILRRTGFMVDTKNLNFILPDDDKIYNFLANDIELYMQKFEVLATEKFKAKEIKKPKLGTIGVRVENNLLSIDLSKININVKELQQIMQKYQLKKKYHRLKDGSFINLEENQDIDFLDKLVKGMDLDYKDIEKEEIKLPVNRSLYLNQILKKEKVNISKNEGFKKITNDLEQDNINEDIEIPKEMENILRDYQKTGYRWLKVLDSYHFGGILADDMGLGKTLQILTVLMDYARSSEEKYPSIVVCPSSLTLNWLNEARKFAPGLIVKVIKGNAYERRKILSLAPNCDLIITSYDSLKRDIDIYKEMNLMFRYIIADEAQYMKNSTTQNAKAIKQLKGCTRYALTGTPIENSLAELWSIFDFVMPGYLFNYKKFKEDYETPIIKEKEEKSMNRLKMLIAPFILRRNKKEVLTELPEKTITVLNNQMGDEQEKVYLSYLSQAKEEVANEININGFEKSQFRILAILTRLRQICCHPGLFIKDYEGDSSKLTQCIEIMKDAIDAGHKILLFSGYTSMFEIIQQELKNNNIKYFKLTGSTKVDERINLVDEFNKNPDIKVFLISLKAGGTGLNLTGADMVIHYDPWWNQSAENQATDRAYRIGQKNNVQVYKLITSNSIEEKIYELQNKKAELIDTMLDTKTSFINKFSKEEIMSLFE